MKKPPPINNEDDMPFTAHPKYSTSGQVWKKNKPHHSRKTGKRHHSKVTLMRMAKKYRINNGTS